MWFMENQRLLSFQHYSIFQILRPRLAIISLVYINSENNKCKLLLISTYFYTYKKKCIVKKRIGNAPKVKKLKCKSRVNIVNKNIVKFTKHSNHIPNAEKMT